MHMARVICGQPPSSARIRAPQAYLDKCRGRYYQGWEGLSEKQQRFAARFQEAFAAFLDHTDDQIGRFVNGLRDIGRLTRYFDIKLLDIVIYDPYDLAVDERDRIDAALAGWARIAPDLDAATMRTALLFARVTALGHKHVDAAFAEVGLSAGEFDVLASLMHAPDRTSKPSVLARSGMLSPAGMTHRLDLLERAGLVERRPDPDDRRSTLVVLTGAGEAKAIEAAHAHVAAEAELFHELGPSDRDDLCRLLETLLGTYSAVAAEPASLQN